jgi:hypothetical protein
MRAKNSSIAVLCLALAGISTPTSATEEDSKTFFAQGRQLRAAGNCTDAIVAFRRAFEMFPQGLGSLRNIAECEEQLGQFASARNDWWSLRRAVLQSNEPKYIGWDKDAEQGYQRLTNKVAKITIVIHGADPTQLRITIDGRPLDPRLVGVELERDLGTHTIQASYGGAAPVTEKRTLSPGAHEVVTLKIPAPKIAPSATPTAPKPPPPRNATLRTAGIISLSAGGVGVIGTVIAAVVRLGAVSNLANCEVTTEGYRCPETLRKELEGDVSTGRAASTITNVFVGLAVVGVGAGIPLLIIGSTPSSPAKPTPATTTKASLVPLAGGGALQLEVRF